MASTPTEPAQVCERCGAPFRCGAQSGDATCWCATLPALPPELLRADAGCLCPACLAALIHEQRAAFRPS